MSSCHPALKVADTPGSTTATKPDLRTLAGGHALLLRESSEAPHLSWRSSRPAPGPPTS
jgi:hypothetical protein